MVLARPDKRHRHLLQDPGVLPPLEGVFFWHLFTAVQPLLAQFERGLQDPSNNFVLHRAVLESSATEIALAPCGGVSLCANMSLPCTSKDENLIGTNYAHWNFLMRVWCIHKGLWELVLGNEKQPERPPLANTLRWTQDQRIGTIETPRHFWQLCADFHRRSLWLCKHCQVPMRSGLDWRISMLAIHQCGPLIFKVNYTVFGFQQVDLCKVS